MAAWVEEEQARSETTTGSYEKLAQATATQQFHF